MTATTPQAGQSQAARLARHSALLLLQSITTTVLGLMGFAFLARALTAEEMGAVVGLTFVSGIAGLLADLGLSASTAKHVAEFRGAGKDYTRIIFAGVAVKIALGIAFGGLTMAVADQLSASVLGSSVYREAFILVGADMALVIVNAALTNSLLGLNMISGMVVVSVGSSVVRLSVLLVALASGLGLDGYVLSWVASSATSVILGLALLFSGRHLRAHGPTTMVRTLRVLLEFSWPLYINSIASFLYSMLDRAVLLVYLPLAQAGVYNVANTAFGVIALVPSAMSTVLFPFYTEKVGGNEQESIKAGIKEASRYVVLVYAPVALGAAAVANPTISLLAGASYAGADILFITLSLFGLLTSLGAAFGGLMLSYGMTKAILLVNLASTAIGLASSVALVPPLGGFGVALTRGLSMTASFLMTFVFLSGRTNAKVDAEGIAKGLISAIVMTCAVVLVQAIWFNRYLLPVYVAAGVVTYFAALKLLRALRPGDFRLAKEVLGGRLNNMVNAAERLLSRTGDELLDENDGSETRGIL